MYGKVKGEKNMEKAFCNSCDEFKDEVNMNSYGTDYYSWDRVDSYNWQDSGDIESDGPYLCPECGDDLEMIPFIDKPTNEWKGKKK